MDDVRLRGGGSHSSFWVLRESFGSSEFIFLTIVFQLCNGGYYVYFSPISGRVFRQEICKPIAYDCRICRGTTDIKGGAGQVVLAELLPGAPALGPRQDDPDVLDAAGAVEFSVGGALVGGQGGWGWRRGRGWGIERGGGSWGGLRCIGAMRPPVRYSRLQCSACCGKVMLSYGGAKG